MSTALRTIEFLCLGIWLGGICLLSFVVAPGAFGILANRDMAGAMVGFTLGRLHLIGIGAGVVYLVAHFLHSSSFPAIARLAAIAVILMLLLTICSQFFVTAKLADLRQQMGSVDRTPATNPLRASFDRLHQLSVWLEGAVLLLGLAAMYLTVRAS
jgi:ABC-type transport system involved in multi-copper enzyme maturation permease subunit